MNEPLPADFLITEADHQDRIVDLARTLGWIVGVTHDSQKSEPGEPDLRMVHEGQRRVIFAETKTQRGRYIKARYAPKTGRLLPGQDDWAQALEACPGVEYYLWRPSHWDDIKELLLPPGIRFHPRHGGT